MMGTVFRRKLYDRMLEWKNRSNGKSALLIEGARRVGKSTIAELFAKNEYSRHIYIDFSKHDSRITDLFEDLSDMDRLFRGLQLYTGVEFIERDTAIIFDEVEEFPRAREAIKHLVEDGRYDYIETGSLISIKKNVKDIIIPSEEEKLVLHPMDFEEFLWAKGNNTLHLMRDYLETATPLNDALHHKIMKEYREYIAVGGMPQVVQAYLDNRSYQEIDRLKRQILDIYLNDFRKIDPSGNLESYYRSIPAELSRESLRYRITGNNKRRISRESRSFFEMEDSRTVEMCYHVDEPRIGLSLTLDRNFFKMYTEDTGLFVTLCFYDNDFSDNVIYEKLVSGRLPADLGYVYENAVAQALVSSGHLLRYHTFKKEDGTHHYEIDFVISDGTKVVPIEVKSSNTASHKSLDKFLEKRSRDVDTAYIISPKNLKKEGKITYLPIYMTGFI